MNRSLALVALAATLTAACSDGTDVASPEFTTTTAAGAMAAARGAEKAAPAATHRYEITIENLTSAQPLSPGVVAVHTKQASVVQVGTEASEGIRLIAENGDPSVASGELASTLGVFDFTATGQPVGCIGCPGPFSTSLTLELEAAANANRLSMAVMLICTNDGFVGLDGVKLPGGFESATFMANGYDAGTEANEETFASIVDPCGAIGPVSAPADGQNTRTATDGTIQPHPGIMGIADLDPSAHGWSEPVARVTVRRIR